MDGAAHADFDLGVFRQGNIMAVEDFPDFDRNQDGVVNDDDLLFAVALRSSTPERSLYLPDDDNKHIALFIQDDWKIFRNLTLNLGLRWDFETGTASPQNLITNFDFDAPAPIVAGVQNRLNSITLDTAVAALNPGIRNLTGLLSFPEGSQQNVNKDRFAPRARRACV